MSSPKWQLQESNLEYTMKKIFVLSLICSVILTLSPPADAQRNFGDMLRAIVKIRANVPKDARTARSLGTEREGNGVIIDKEGHILTIGYPILEAESVEVTIAESQVFAAAVVGYDHHSGFGLIKAQKPPATQP